MLDLAKEDFRAIFVMGDYDVDARTRAGASVRFQFGRRRSGREWNQLRQKKRK
jgi:hypothetical protein